MKISGKTLWLVSTVAALVIVGVLWVLVMEGPYVKSQYYKTNVKVTIELQWPADAEYGEIQTKLVYNRPFAFILKHEPKHRSWSWSRIYVYTDWKTGEPMYPNSTIVRFPNVERPATLITWVRYYDDIAEIYNGVKLERGVILDTVRYEYSVTPMSK